MERVHLELLRCPHSKARFELTALVEDRGRIDYGLLSSEAGTFPIIAGIPVLFLNREHLVAELKAERWQRALASAAIGPAPTAGIWRLTQFLRDTHRFRKLGRRLEANRERTWLDDAVRKLVPSPQQPLSPHDCFDFAYRQCGIRVAEVFNYNYYRYGMPRHLVALAYGLAIENPGPILDLACGAGHITWSIAQHQPNQLLLGLDSFFFSLYVAKASLLPNALFVCGDVNALPFADGSIGTVFSSDAFFNFQSKWACVREQERVLNQTGTMMMVGQRNKLKTHLYPGRPLSPQGYRHLVAHLDHRVLPDGLVLDHYLAGKALPLDWKTDEQHLANEDTLSIIASKGRLSATGETRSSIWPHALGQLSVNPLFREERSNYFVRRSPSAFYDEENQTMNAYLPQSFELDSAQRAALDRGDHETLATLIGSCALLGLPTHYRAEDSIVDSIHGSNR